MWHDGATGSHQNNVRFEEYFYNWLAQGDYVVPVVQTGPANDAAHGFVLITELQQLNLARHLSGQLTAGRRAVVWRCMLQVAKGLSRIHSLGIMHGDLKLENVFNYVNGTCKIGDFGSAGTRNPLKKPKRCGTFGYIAPEREERTDMKVDIYSFGKMVQTALCDEQQTMSGPEKDIVDRCLAVDAEKRPTAAELVQRIHDLVSGVPIRWNRMSAS